MDRYEGGFSIRHNYTFQLLTSVDEMLDLANDWRRLYNSTLPRNPFLSSEWSLAWWQHLCPASTPFLVTAWLDGDLIGLAPLRLDVKFRLRILRFLADGRSDYLGFLVAPDHAVVERLLLERIAVYHHSWDVIAFRQLSELYTSAASINFGEGFCRVEMGSISAPYLTSPIEWTELRERGPSQLRRTTRKIRKFVRDGGVVKRISGTDLSQTLKQITTVEANSWKAGTEAARFQATDAQKMLEQALRTLGAEHQMEVWLAKINDISVAYLLNFSTQERTCYYQGAYHKDFGKYSPGDILHYHAIEHTWLHGSREYDFMMGNEQWKSGWTNKQRELQHISAFKRSPLGYLAFTLLHGPRWYFRRFSYARSAYSFWRKLWNNLPRLE